MRRIFEWYASGTCSLEELRDRAAAEGLTTRRGGPPSKSTIERILKNPFYMGTFTWGGKTYQGTHEPLISVELFQRAQDAMRKTNHPVQEKKRSFAYTGLITCAHCGCAITAGVHKRDYVYYHCTGARGNCEARLIREDRLEDLLGGLVEQVRIDDETIEWIVAALKESHREERAYHDQQIEKLQADVRKLQARIDAVYEDKLDGKVSEDFWTRKSREWRDQQIAVMTTIEQHQRANQFYFDAGVKVLRLAQRAHTLWLAQPPTERRRLLDVLLLNCTFDGTKLSPTYRKPFCWLAEGPVSSIWRG